MILQNYVIVSLRQNRSISVGDFDRGQNLNDGIQSMHIICLNDKYF
jgi:hypothetical protein